MVNMAISDRMSRMTEITDLKRNIDIQTSIISSILLKALQLCNIGLFYRHMAGF
jgi:hypothetical protein